MSRLSPAKDLSDVTLVPNGAYCRVILRAYLSCLPRPIEQGFLSSAVCQLRQALINTFPSVHAEKDVCPAYAPSEIELSLT